MTLTVVGDRISGDRNAGLYPVANQNGMPLGNLLTDRVLRLGAAVEAAEVPPRNPPVTFNGHNYHYMQQ